MCVCVCVCVCVRARVCVAEFWDDRFGGVPGVGVCGVTAMGA